MTTDYQQALDEARRAGSASPADHLLERLAESLGAKAGVQAVFGEPITREGLTVIPVARVRWGFGGGGGSAKGPESGPASGSGAAAVLLPTPSATWRSVRMGRRSGRSGSHIQARCS